MCSTIISAQPFASRNSHMSLLKADRNSQWLIKQRKGAYVDSQMTPVLETLGTRMAERIGIICNHVKLVPMSACKKYKRAKNQPATLHSYVPGVNPRATEEMATLNIHQSMEWSCGKKCGFTKYVIEGMSRHPALPRIVALDTYIGNSDRSAVNILYDPKMRIFYAIDFGFSFKSNLAKGALETLRALEHARVVFTQAELAALVAYRDTLRILIRLFRPAVMQTEFEKLVRKAGLLSKHASFAEGRKGFKQALVIHKNFMYETYHSTTRLVRYLDGALTRYQKRMQQEST